MRSLSFHSSARSAQALLMTVLVVGAVVLAVGVGMARQGMAEIAAGLDARQSLRALALAEGCADEALLRIAADHSYRGGTLSLGEGACQIVVDGPLDASTVTVSATVRSWTRKLTLRVDASGGHIQILDWIQDRG